MNVASAFTLSVSCRLSDPEQTVRKRAVIAHNIQHGIPPSAIGRPVTQVGPGPFEHAPKSVSVGASVD